MLTDSSFEEARDVTSIEVRLHPIDVGFDLREIDGGVALPNGSTLRVSYPDERGCCRVMSGPRSAVVERLRALGFRVVGEEAP